ncbi:MAG TPA: TlpA disulfide reductase family protein [Gammaproteobacteria bacterium]
MKSFPLCSNNKSFDSLSFHKKAIKKASLLSLILFLLAITAVPVLAAQPAPNLTLKTLNNQDLKISELKGDVVYVDFWATWCPPCRQSFPWMEEMHQRYSNLGFKIVAISLDTKRDVIDQFLKTMTTNFTIAHDPGGESATAFQVKGMPSSYLIDRKGNVHLTHMGFNDRDKAKLESQIKDLIAKD